MNRGADGGGKEMGLVFTRHEVPSNISAVVVPVLSDE